MKCLFSIPCILIVLLGMAPLSLGSAAPTKHAHIKPIIKATGHNKHGDWVAYTNGDIVGKKLLRYNIIICSRPSDEKTKKSIPSCFFDILEKRYFIQESKCKEKQEKTK